MRRYWTALGACQAAAALLAACSSAPKTNPPPACGTAPPNPTHVVGLAYPQSGTTGLPVSLPELVFQGYPSDWQGLLGITLLVNQNFFAKLGDPTAAPSPLPSPFQDDPKLPATFYARQIEATLSPNTTYQVWISGFDWSPYPGPEGAHCAAYYGYVLGHFQTGP
jgi:hypothetical protein